MLPHPVIVLEDLCLGGYDILRDRLFNLDEVKACLHKLACWHAVSHKVTLQQRDVSRMPVPTEVAECERLVRAAVVSLQYGLFTATNLMNSAYMHNGKRNVIAALGQAGGFEVYLTKLLAMQPQVLDRCMHMNNAYGAAKKGSIYVLNHDDFQTRNQMVRQTGDGRVEDAVFFTEIASVEWSLATLITTKRMSSIAATAAAPDYDEDELTPPQWLDTTFLERILQPSKSNEKIKITNIAIEPATKKGEHYASVMYRVNVAFTLPHDCNAAQRQQRKSFIVKASPELHGKKQRLLQNSKLFETEIAIYTEVLPQLDVTLLLAGESVKFGAKCLYNALAPVKVLVFEDLAQLGYEIVRSRSLTTDEIKASYRKLAKWHATSFKLAKEHPAGFKKYSHSFMTIPYIVNSSFISSGIKNFIDMLDTVPTLVAYKAYFLKLQPDWAGKCRATYTEYFLNRQHQTYYGICHGDLLGNNLMFKCNPSTGELLDVLLVDYQLAYMGPLVNDLIYAFFMVYSAEQRANNHEELLAHYFSNFVQTLEKLGCQKELMSFEQFKDQLKRQKTLALFLLLSFLPIRYALRAGRVDRDHMMATDEERRELYFDKNYIAELHTILPMYLRLDYLQ